MMTFEQAVKKLTDKHGHIRDVVKLRYAEDLVSGMLDTDGIPNFVLIRRHEHPVIRITRWGEYRLDDCGWRTVTTKKTLNTYGPVRVYSKNHQWMVSYINLSGCRVSSQFRPGQWFSDTGTPYVNSNT